MSRSSGTGEAADTTVHSRRLMDLGGETRDLSSTGRGEMPSLNDDSTPDGGDNLVGDNGACLVECEPCLPDGSNGEDTNDSLVGMGDMAEASSVLGASTAENPSSERGVLGNAPSVIHHGAGDD